MVNSNSYEIVGYLGPLIKWKFGNYFCLCNKFRWNDEQLFDGCELDRGL